jgi:cell division transport system permease protein
MFSQFFYLFKESFRGWMHHRLMLLSSMLTITLCCFILCASIVFLNVIIAVSVIDSQEYMVEVFLHNDFAEGASLDSLTQRVLADPGVDSIYYFSKDEAMALFVQNFGQDMVQMLDVNPLPASLWVYPDSSYHHSAALQQLATRMGRLQGVEHVHASTQNLELVERWKLPIFVGLAIAIFGLTALLWIIIGNSVRLTLYARRDVVENMKYCGGGSFFIAFPFVLEGFFQGLAGSLVAVSFWAGIIWFLNEWIFVFQEGWLPYPLLFGVVLFSVSMLGAYTSRNTVKNYLKTT